MSKSALVPANVLCVSRYSHITPKPLVDIVSALTSKELGVTQWAIVSSKDIDAIDKLFRYNPETDSIVGNRDRAKSDQANMAQDIPTLDAFDAEVSCMVVGGCEVKGNKVSTAGCNLSDGGGRYRRLRHLLTQDAELVQSVIVRIMFSTRPASMGGFNKYSKVQSQHDEFSVQHSDNPELAQWGTFLQSFGNTFRNRVESLSPKGSGKSGTRWGGVELSVQQAIGQWDNELLDVWNAFTTPLGDCQTTLYSVFESIGMNAKKWKQKQTEYALCSVFDLLGVVDKHGHNCLGGVDCFDPDSLGKAIDKLSAKADNISKLWDAWRLVSPKADESADYSVLFRIIEDVVRGNELKSTYFSKKAGLIHTTPLANLGANGLYNYYHEGDE